MPDHRYDSRGEREFEPLEPDTPVSAASEISRVSTCYITLPGNLTMPNLVSTCRLEKALIKFDIEPRHLEISARILPPSVLGYEYIRLFW